MQQTKLGCEVFVRKGNYILLGKRKNCYGAGMWGLPGGHLEYDEKLVDAICREIKEELGGDVSPNDLRVACITDDFDGGHYVHITFELINPDFEPRLMEPEKCEEWRYFPIDKLPNKDLFGPHKGIIETYIKKKLYLGV